MSDRDFGVQIHFVLNNKVKRRDLLYHMPRVGDELRFSENEFYKVKRIVWVYDEKDLIIERANIEIEKA